MNPETKGIFGMLWNQSGHCLSAIPQSCFMETFGRAISYGRMDSLWLSSTGRMPRSEIPSLMLPIVDSRSCGHSEFDAMQRFTQQYQSMTTIDFTNLPHWDLCAALRPVAQLAQWGLDDTTEKQCEKDTDGLSSKHLKSSPLSERNKRCRHPSITLT